ncbi:hypothetical protein E3N88_18933 [Mikania micrantha]|uniref:Uncharacterized protein n=1 Tax=Mikania micrantha TaxID=192012 RepID=A0A5N6NPS8_9ASTR|nr:hypothetical protein E3N88_18933 [Mikania micrantha]
MDHLLRRQKTNLESFFSASHLEASNASKCRADAEIFFLFEVQEEEEKRNHRPMVLLERTVCDCSYPTPREVLVTAPQVVSEMLLRGEAEAAKEEKLTLFQKQE